MNREYFFLQIIGINWHVNTAGPLVADEVRVVFNALIYRYIVYSKYLV